MYRKKGIITRLAADLELHNWATHKRQTSHQPRKEVDTDRTRRADEQMCPFPTLSKPCYNAVDCTVVLGANKVPITVSPVLGKALNIQAEEVTEGRSYRSASFAYYDRHI